MQCDTRDNSQYDQYRVCKLHSHDQNDHLAPQDSAVFTRKPKKEEHMINYLIFSSWETQTHLLL